MDNKTEEKKNSEEIKEAVSDQLENIGEKTKHVVTGMKDRYENASPFMQKVIFGIIVAISASIITMIKLAIFRHCMSSKSDKTNK